jgi:hypothetical protein
MILHDIAGNQTGWHTVYNGGAGTASPHWLVVDMRTRKKLTGFLYQNVFSDFGSALPKAFTIDVSDNGTDWTTVWSTTAMTTDRDSKHPLVLEGGAVWAQYYRIHITEVYGGYNYTYVAHLVPIEPTPPSE